MGGRIPASFLCIPDFGSPQGADSWKVLSSHLCPLVAECGNQKQRPGADYMRRQEPAPACTFQVPATLQLPWKYMRPRVYYTRDQEDFTELSSPLCPLVAERGHTFQKQRPGADYMRRQETVPA